jgi:predicted acylesterase/phospholipase RssA
LGNRSERIGLALSGGGFRATLFHLGVIRYLYDSGLLSRVQTITSVSGGSILAAHLAVNWDKYNGDQAAFEEAAGELVKFSRIDVRGRIVRRWLCGSLLLFPRLFKTLTFDTLLKKSYSRLYRNATIKDLSGSPSHPEFHILATSLTTGGVCKFTGEGFIHFDRDEQERIIRNNSLPVSIAVAASSAFPPLFPPIAVSRKLLNADSKDFDKTQYLTDGGVFDNLGLHELSRMAKQETGAPWRNLVVSDAGGNFDWTIGNRYAFFVSRNVRATDILMDRVSKLVPAAIVDKESPICHIFIGRELSEAEAPEAQPPEVQRGVRNIRTDLDSFSLSEIRALVKQGYEEARFSLRTCGIGLPLRGNTLTWRLIVDSQSPSRKKLEIEDAKRRKLRLFASKDSATWFLVVLALMWIAPFAWIPVRSYLQARTATAQLAAKTKEFDALITKLGTLKGIVRDENGQPISGATVAVRVEADFGVFHTLTDDSGVFLLDLQDKLREALLTGRADEVIRIEVGKRGYQTRTSDSILGSASIVIILHKEDKEPETSFEKNAADNPPRRPPGPRIPRARPRTNP